MKSFSLVTASVIAFGFVASPALALSSRTFVSGAGSDSGGCGLTAPCRTFAYAITQTAANGEIIVLSSAGYGPVTITQSVSIINISNFAGVTVASENGITINAGSSDAITLRGLTIDGGGTGSNGIVYNSGNKLTIDQCNLLNFVGSSSTGNGIIIQPSSGTHKFLITNTTASNNQNDGVLYLPSGTATGGIVIDHVTAANNGIHGLAFNNFGSSGTGAANISNSIASFNGHDGFALSNVTASIDASSASNNGSDGVDVGGATILALGRSVLMSNGGYGLFTGATVNSYKDNRIAGNTSGQVSATPPAATLY